MAVEVIAKTRNTYDVLQQRNVKLLEMLYAKTGGAQLLMKFLLAADRWAESRGVPIERVGYHAIVTRDGACQVRFYDTELGGDDEADPRNVPETDLEANLEEIRT